MGETDVHIDEALCTGCGACVHDCIQHNIVRENGKAHTLWECKKCGGCEAICPDGAPGVPCDRIMPIPAETLGRFIENRRTDPKNDYLFRDASAVLFIESPDPLDAGLAAGAIEMVAHTLGIGVLYNGYLRRVVDSCPAARAYFDMSDERGLNVCMLLGYQQKRYYRTAPRRFPSVVLR